MKVTGKELKAAIRSIVAEEIKKALPGMIREQLTENYLRKMMRESREDESGPLQFDAGRDQSVPSPKRQDNSGIYDEKYSDDVEEQDDLALESRRRNKMNTSLLSKNNPMAFLYEGVKPIDQEAPIVGGGPEIDAMENAGFDFNRMANLAQKLTAPRGSIQMTPEAKMRELKAKRDALDVPVK